MPAPRPRSPRADGPAHAAADAQHRDARARCRAIRRSAASARGTWSRRSTRWAARWRSPPTRPASSSAPSIRARGRRCARRARRPTACSTRQAIRRRLENQPNLTLFQQAVDDLTRLRRRDGASPASSRRSGCAFEARRRRADDRHLPVGPDPRRPGELRGRARRRSAGEDARRAAARAAAAGRAAQDRHAAAARRPHDRFLGAGRAAGRRSGAGVLVPGHARACTRAQVPCWITHTNERTHEIIRGGLDRSPLFTGRHRGRRARATARRSRTRSCASPSATSHQIFLEPEGLDTHEIYPNGISTSLPFDVQLDARALDPRAARTRTSCGPATRSSTTTSIRAALKPTLETKAIARALLRRADQRHDRLRGSRGAGAAGRASTPAASCARRGRLVPAPRRGLPRRAGRRPRHARRDASPTGCSRRAPSTGCSCARTTPTCG